jgi:hypothetical protein
MISLIFLAIGFVAGWKLAGNSLASLKEAILTLVEKLKKL